MMTSDDAGVRYAGRPAPGARPGEGDRLATDAAGNVVMRYDSASPWAELDGDIEAMSLWVGQSVGLVHDIRPVREVVESLASEAASTLAANTALIRP
jgi:nitronate monooxygenase